MRAIGFRAFVKETEKMLPVTDLCFNETEAIGASGCGCRAFCDNSVF